MCPHTNVCVCIYILGGATRVRPTETSARFSAALRFGILVIVSASWGGARLRLPVLTQLYLTASLVLY
jgi:hypothetical protein